MKQGIKKTIKWCRRYLSLTLFVVIAFILFVLFFNENSLIQRLEYNRQITNLKEEIQQNLDTTQYYQDLYNKLNTDPETMERIVREQYHMQRSNEDVYIFE